MDGIKSAFPKGFKVKDETGSGPEEKKVELE